MNQRYERRLRVIPSNQAREPSIEVFNHAATLASAVVDGPVHRATSFAPTSNSQPARHA